MKFFITVQILIPLFLSASGFSARAENEVPMPQVTADDATCAGELHPDFAKMLRELGVREKFLIYLTEEDEDVNLLVPFYRVWRFMKTTAFEQMTRTVHSIGQIAPESAERVRENPFFKKFPKLYDENSLRTFFYLYCHVKRESVTDFELGLMAYLFEQQLTAEGAPQATVWSMAPSYEQRLEQLLKLDANRNRMYKLMQIKSLEDSLMITLAIGQIKKPGNPVSVIANRIRAGRDNSNDRGVLTYFMMTFGNVIAKGTTSKGDAITIPHNNRDVIFHDPFVIAADEWLIKNIPDMNEADRADQVRMLDYFMFGTPPPIRMPVFNSAFVNRGSSLFEGAKARHRDFIIEQQRNELAQATQNRAPQPVAAPAPPIEIRLETSAPAPTAKAPKRRNLPKQEQAPTPEPRPVQPSNSIPKAQDLAGLITPVNGDKFAPLQNLKEMKTYLFYFERKSHGVGGKLQRIVFSEEVITWIKDYPQQGLALIKAILRGIVTRDEGQNGLRLMHFRESTAFSGNIYEVKTVNDDRVLTLPVNGRWQVIEVAPHSKAEARAKILLPMLEN